MINIQECLSLPNLCAACMSCPCYYQEYHSFLLNVFEKEKLELSYNIHDNLCVIFGIFNRFTEMLTDDLQAYHQCLRGTLNVCSGCVELSLLEQREQLSSNKEPLFHYQLCPSQVCPSVSEEHRITGLVPKPVDGDKWFTCCYQIISSGKIKAVPHK